MVPMRARVAGGRPASAMQSRLRAPQPCWQRCAVFVFVAMSVLLALGRAESVPGTNATSLSDNAEMAAMRKEIAQLRADLAFAESLPCPPCPSRNGSVIVAMGGISSVSSPSLQIEPDVLVLQEEDPIWGAGWSRVGPMATPRGLAGSAKLGDSLYIVGGTTLDMSGARRTTAIVDRMDFDRSNSSSTWVTLAPLPYASEGTNCEAVGVSMYCALQPPRDVLGKRMGAGQLLRYDPEADTWTRLADLPQPVIASATAASRSTLYLVGGNLNGMQGTGLTNAWAYSFATDTWTALPNMTVPRSGHQLALLNGTLVALGGMDQNGGVPQYADVLSLNGTDPCKPWQWQRVTMTGYKYFTGATSVTLAVSQSLPAGGVATFGGRGGSNVFDNVQVFDWAANATHTPPNMPVAMRNAMVVAL